jgi:hypothetical protein
MMVTAFVCYVMLLHRASKALKDYLSALCDRSIHDLDEAKVV